MKKAILATLAILVAGCVAYLAMPRHTEEGAKKTAETQTAIQSFPIAADKPTAETMGSVAAAPKKTEQKKEAKKPAEKPKEQPIEAPATQPAPEPVPVTITATVPVQPAPPQTTPAPQPAPAPQPIINPTPMPENEPSNILPVNPPTITVVSPIPGKGMGREYKASPEVVDESNYVEIGAVLRDGQGNVLDMPKMEVTATDASQNKEMQGTGNYNPSVGKYYPFHYEFHTPGKHVVTFTAEGVSTSVEFEVK